MVETAILDAGSIAEKAVVIGDTSYDMAMAKRAGAHAIGVSWGYHPTDGLKRAGADSIADTFSDIPALVRALI